MLIDAYLQNTQFNINKDMLILHKFKVACTIITGCFIIYIYISGQYPMYIKKRRDRLLFWHWIWCELGKPNVMKRARHRYHYAVRCCKKSKV